MDYLPIGSVVELKQRKKNQQLMIIGHFPLKRKGEELGYYDYSACLYPQGLKGNITFFFNAEDVDKVIYPGLVEDKETEDYDKQLTEIIGKAEYPKLKVEIEDE